MHSFFQELKQGSQALGLELSDEALNLLLKYQDALVLWNKAYNLTAIRDPKEMLVKHLLDLSVPITNISLRIQLSACRNGFSRCSHINNA